MLMKEAVRFVMVQLFLPCPMWTRFGQRLDLFVSKASQIELLHLTHSIHGPRRRSTHLSVDRAQTYRVMAHFPSLST